MKRIREGTFFVRIEHHWQKLWPEVNSKVHVSKVCFPAGSQVMKVPNHVVDPNKGMEGALTARGVLLVSIPTHGYPVILCFTFLFTSSLSTVHCLGQGLFFLKITHFAKHMTGMKQPFYSKDVAFVNFQSIASQGITPQCERKSNSF